MPFPPLAHLPSLRDVQLWPCIEPVTSKWMQGAHCMHYMHHMHYLHYMHYMLYSPSNPRAKQVEPVNL